MTRDSQTDALTVIGETGPKCHIQIVFNFSTQMLIIRCKRLN